MKKCMILCLIAAICIGVLGCSEPVREITSPVSFYYRQAEFSHGSVASVLQAESRESAGHEGDISYLLSLYLQGPESDNLRQTFPEGTTLINFAQAGTTAYVTVNDAFAQLTGIDLTVACACITKTVMALTGDASVQIKAETATLGNAPFILMDEASLLMLDSSEAYAAP